MSTLLQRNLHRAAPLHRFVVCCFAAPLCGGCGSAVERISDGAQHVQLESSSIRSTSQQLLELSAAAHSDFQDLNLIITDPAGKSLDPAVAAHKTQEGMDLMQQIIAGLHSIDASATKITATAASITHDIPSIQDRVPWWASLLKQWGTILAVAGVCGLLLYLGLWPVIRRFVALATGWTSLIPTGVVASAKLDSEALALPTVDPVQREAVAVRRRNSKDYDAAFRIFNRAASPKPHVGDPTPPPVKEPSNG